MRDLNPRLLYLTILALPSELTPLGLQVPKPKKHILKEITEFVTMSMENGDGIILLLDANDAIDDRANDYTKHMF